MNRDDAERTATQKAHELGRAIVTGRDYPPGQTITLNAVMEKLAVSRAMAREVLQVLHLKRLVQLQPRVGASVCKAEEWDYFDHDIMAWRLSSDDRWLQLQSLTQLREAIEPRAAELAAHNASLEIRRDLVRLSRELRTIGQDATFELRNKTGEELRYRYSEVDVGFHTALLAGSGNEMFLALATPTKTALEHRIKQSWAGAVDHHAEAGINTGATKPFPRSPDPAALWLHCGLAHAVKQIKPAAAKTFAQAVLAEIQVDRLKEPVLRYGLRLALAQLNPEGFDTDEWAGFRGKITELGKEPDH